MNEPNQVKRGAGASRYVIVAATAMIAGAMGGRLLPTPSTASAQIPDAGRQRWETIEELKRTNELLAAILDHLRKKPIKAVVESADKPQGQPERPRRR